MTNLLDISRELQADGFEEIRRGKHRVFQHPELGQISVPNHPGKSINPGLVSEIRCQVKRAKRGLKRWETNK